MRDKKLLVVVGASGVRGSSVVRGLLTNPGLFSQFSIRGLLRDPVKAEEKAQYPNFIEWAKADVNDLESLQKAFDGAHTVFGVTDYWQVFSAEAEAKQWRSIADAAKATGVKHLIWSAQYSAKRLSGESIPQLLISTPSTGSASTSSKSKDAEKSKVGFVDAVRDTGVFVAGMMRMFQKTPKSMNGRYVHAVTEFLTPNEFGATYKKVRGEELRYNEVTLNEFQAILPPMLADLPHQMAMVREFGLYGKDEVDVQPDHDKVLGEGVEKSSWEEYLRRDWDQDVKNPMITMNIPTE